MTIPLSPDTRSPVVTFWGAARKVTGSMHLVEHRGDSLLLDCGLTLGPRSEARLHTPQFPFAPASLRAVLLSHAHIDHCGNLPHLVRQGFAGPIFCTPATHDLLPLMLGDSARHQEHDAFVRAVVGGAGGEDPVPHGIGEDARQAVRQCVPVPYGREQAVTDRIRFRFVDAGHILGSAMVALQFAGSGRDVSLTFTGDLGRPALGFLRRPAPVPPADLLVCESTYGARRHDPVEQTLASLHAVVRRTIERGGKVLIPAFSLGRTQLVVHYLYEGIRRGQMPAVPVYVDSPLGAAIAEVHCKHPECLAEPDVASWAALAPDGDGAAPPGPGVPSVHYLRTADESKEVSTRRGPCVIVASGGMCEGGRILNHLAHNIDDPRCTVVLVSYQAPYTLGHRLLARGPRVRFRGHSWNKWADVLELSGFSGHADQDDFTAALAPLAARAGKVRLVHGEPESAEALAGVLRGLGFADVAVPVRGEAVAVAS